MLDIQELNRSIEAQQDKLFQTLSELIQINSENFGAHGNEEP